MRKLLTAVVVLVALLVGVDRLAVYVASSALAGDVAKQQPECARPGVDIGGFPFLTQAFAGRYDDVTLTTTCNQDGRRVFNPVRVTLHGARVPLGLIVHRSVKRVPVDYLDATATVPFATLDQRAGPAGLRFSAGPNHSIIVTGILQVAGQSITAHGVGRVTYSNGSVRITVDKVVTPAGSIGTGSGLDATIPLPVLPFSLTEAGVSASSDGVVISARARHVVLEH